MKKFILLPVLFLVSLLVSCEGDNDQNADTASIIGKWNFNKIGYVADGVNVPEVDYYQNQPGCSKNYLQFNESSVLNSGQYSSDCVLVIQDVPYSHNGSTLNFDSGSQSTPNAWEIVSVTATELKIQGDMTGLEGVEPGVNLLMNLSFTKAE